MNEARSPEKQSGEADRTQRDGRTRPPVLNAKPVSATRASRFRCRSQTGAGDIW